MRVPEDVRQQLRDIYAQVPGAVFGEIAQHMRALAAAPDQLAHHVKGVLHCRHTYSFSVLHEKKTYTFMLAVRNDGPVGWSIVGVGFAVMEGRP